MARIRTIKPDAFRSETLSEVTLTAERTFFGLLTEVDDDGRFKDRPAVLNGALWSLRAEHNVTHMEEDIEELVNVGLACRYQVDGVKYLHLPSFKRHQYVQRPTKSKLPACPACLVDDGGQRVEVVLEEPTLLDDLSFPTPQSAKAASTAGKNVL